MCPSFSKIFQITISFIWFMYNGHGLTKFPMCYGRVTIESQNHHHRPFLLDFSPIKFGIHTLWVVAKVLVTASSFHRPSGMLHTLRQVIDQDWMQQSSLSAAYVCHSNQLHMLQFNHRNKTQYGHLSAFCWIIKLKKKRKRSNTCLLLPHQSKYI